MSKKTLPQSTDAHNPQPTSHTPALPAGASVSHFISHIDFALLIALLIPLLAIMPLLTHAGLPNTADGPAHLMRQVELNQAWAQGNFYPRWGTDLALGHGMPIFSYAPPMLYQLTQIIHLSGLPLDASMKGVIVFGFVLYSLGMFLFARRIYGVYPALLAASVYVYAPYRLREAYIQGNYGQFLGLAFYPLIFWAFHGLITTGRARYWIAAPIMLAGLLFSHNISFMIFVPIFAAYLLFLIILTTFEEAKKRRSEEAKKNSSLSHLFASSLPLFLRTVAAGLLGLGLSAIFWLPAFGERHDIKLEGITQGFFDFRENFISLPDLLSPPLPLDLSAINPHFPLSLGLPQIIFAVLAVAALAVFLLTMANGNSANRQIPNPTPVLSNAEVSQISYPKSQISHSIFFIIFLLFYSFLALPYSQLLWENIPLIELAEFPWRMLGPAIFCAAVLSAAALAIIIYYLPFTNRNAPALITTIAIIIVIALNAHYLYPSQFIQWGNPTPADAFAYEVTSGAIGTTSTGEFLPRWAQQHPVADTLWPDYEAGQPPQKLDPTLLPEGATVKIMSHLAETDTLQVDTPQDFTAVLRTLYWPGWQVYLNNQPIPFTITPNTGLIQLDIPVGQHTLTLQLESTPLRTTGLWLTLITITLLFGIAIYALKSKPLNRQFSKSQIANSTPQTKNSELQTPNSKLFVLFAAVIIALFFLSRPLEPFFVQQSNPDLPQPADQNVQVDFADQLRLVGLDNLPQTVQLPDTLNAVLYWRAQQDIDTNYSIFLHLDAPNGETLAAVDEVSPENIPTANWPPGLYLRNPLHLSLPADLPPIRYNLNVGVYNRETGERLAIEPGGATTHTLSQIWLLSDTPNTPKNPLATFGQNITLHRADYAGGTLTLVWRTTQSIDTDFSIFVHLTDSDGTLLTQYDGPPYSGLYPLTHWLPGQQIEDTRQFPPDTAATTIAIGIYDPATGQRLTVIDADGNPLPNNSFTLPVSP